MTDASTGATSALTAGERPRKSKLRENVEAIGTALILFLVVRTFFIQAFRIPSESMENTLLVGDFLFVNKLAYGPKVPFTDYRLPGFRDIERGDVIVFKNPVDRKTDFIKRCVAVAGDTLEVRANVLYINGEARQEDYTKFTTDPLHPGVPEWPSPGQRYVVPEDHFFAMGDNRNNSSDSRRFATLAWMEHHQRIQPAVPMELVVGRAEIIYASFDHDRYFLPRLGRLFHLVR